MRMRSELHDALESGDQERVAALLRDGADIEEHNSHGWTPLMAASLHGQVDLARFLHEHGADLHRTNREGKAAIHYAAPCASASVIDTLMGKERRPKNSRFLFSIAFCFQKGSGTAALKIAMNNLFADKLEHTEAHAEGQ